MDCPRCGLTCVDQQAVITHALAVHLPEHARSTFPCILCNKELENLNALRRHYRAIHLGLYSYKKCKQCLIVFESYKAMVEHRKTAHPIPRMAVTCPTCKRGFTSVRRLELHRKYAADETPEGLLPCRHCSQLSRTLNQRRKHEHAVHGTKKFVCTVEGCTYATPNARGLASHLQTHERAQTRAFQCPSCVKTYSTQNALRRHVATFHTTARADDTDKPGVPCLLCNRRLSSPKVLKEHMRNYHDPQRSRYQCQLCDFFALHQNTLDFHEIEKHGVQTAVVVEKETSDITPNNKAQ